VRHQENQKFNAMDEYGNYIKFVFPKISQTLRWGKFHSKLMILKFPNFLRIIIPSANLTDGDWYYWGQIIWFQDFFLISDNKTKEENDKQRSGDFRNYLKAFMKTFMPHTYEGKRFWTDLKIDFDLYDFSDASVDLVASANGRFIGEGEKDLFGVGRLNNLMETKYFNIEKNNNLLIQCSSFGISKQKNFFSNLYKGFNLTEENNIDIFYPTEQYINSCEKGLELSSCLFFNSEANKIYQDKLHNIILKEKFKDRKTVFHSKIFITGKRNKLGNFILNNDSIIYIGSHNFSTSAWGNYEKNGTQMSVANYELGVIFDVNLLNFQEKLDIYNNLLFNFDAPKYTEDDIPFITDNI
jgi:tyrosyl-DNA phosphodiesterase-1